MAYTIAFCGIDGSGKTTQINLIEGWLLKKCNVKKTKVDFHNLEVIYRLCEKRYGDPCAYGNLPADLVRTAISFDVAYHYLHLRPEIKTADVVLCDRHKICFRAYGMAYGVKDFTWIDEILSLVEEPDLIIYFDVDIDVSNYRIKSRVEKVMRSDEMPQHLKQVQCAYETLLKRMKNVFIVDGNKPLEYVNEEIKKEIEKRFLKGAVGLN